MRFLPFLLIFCLVPASFGQNLATVTGIVTDPSMQSVPNAEVRTQSIDTRAVRTTRTGDGGQYELPGLAPGEYTVEVRAKGFAEATHTLHLEVGQSARLDLTLQVGEATTAIEIAARAETLKTEDASLGEVVEMKSVQELPLNGRSCSISL